MTETKPPCSKILRKPEGRWGYKQQCKKKANFQGVDGKYLCGIHSPEGIKKRADKWNAKYDAEAKKLDLKYSIKDAEAEVVEAAREFCQLGDYAGLAEAVSILEELYDQRV